MTRTTEQSHIKPIPGFPLYGVSADGRAWTCRVPGHKTITRSNWTRLVGGFRSGYPCVGIRDEEGVRHYYSIHRLVAGAFLAPVESKPLVNHKNGIKTDNRVENLEWCDYTENMRHAFANGLNRASRGEDKGNSKLTEAQVLEIRRLRKTGLFHREIAKQFGVSYSSIQLICQGLRWAWLKEVA